MAYKIAAASSDGKVVNQHFGRATRFLVFNIEDDKAEFEKVIETSPFCGEGGHDDTRLTSSVELLKGVRAVLVSQVGRGAARALEQEGIAVFDIGDFIDHALKKLIEYYSRIDGGKKNG